MRASAGEICQAPLGFRGGLQGTHWPPIMSLGLQYLMVGYMFLRVTHFSHTKFLQEFSELRKPCKVLDYWITQFRFRHGPLALVSEDLMLGCQF